MVAWSAFFKFRLLKSDNEIVKMSEGIIENDQVAIFNGPLKGMEGTIKRINRHKKVAVIRWSCLRE